jgi:diadenosine tetraphosphate (Ap4A) HIT family hydrolase
MPPKLPQEAPDEEVEQETNAALSLLLLEAAHAFHQCLPDSKKSTWDHMVKMIKLVERDVQALSDKTDLQSALSDLSVGGKSYHFHVIPAFQ